MYMGFPVIHPAAPTQLMFLHLIDGNFLKERLAVEIHLSGMVVPPLSSKPVTGDHVLVRVVVTEEAVGQRYLPYAVLYFFPAGNDLGTRNDNFFAFRRPVDDAFVVGCAPAGRIDTLAVNTLVHGDHITWLRNLPCRRDGLERLWYRTVIRITSSYRNMIFRCRGQRLLLFHYDDVFHPIFRSDI
ncbi:hypothetical protein ES703_67332 [subsurface metagenome]